MGDMLKLMLFLPLLCGLNAEEANDGPIADCPLPQGISPCECKREQIRTGSFGLVVSCQGVETVQKLTTILRSNLCNHEIAKFRLVSSNIGYLPSNLFSKVYVKDIHVSFTNISHFTEAGRSAFNGLEEVLETLTMRKCFLVDELKWEKIGDLEVLKSLDLSENTLTEIPSQWFRHSPRNLRFLYLRGNRINHVHPRALSSMYKLSVLDLSENSIQTLERSMFPFPANSLAILTLSYNELEDLPNDFFNEMFGLKRLFLDHNQFETLREEVFTPIWSELTILDVLDNRINCTCSMRWISRLYPMDFLYGYCIGPESLKGRKLKSLWDWDFFC